MPTQPIRRRHATRLAALCLALGGCGADSGQGVAAADKVVAPCASDVDCAALDDGNLCNGSLACTDGTCRFDPATAVVCPTGGDTDCAASTCDPADGACAIRPRREGLVCDNGDPCTLGATCAKGACKAGTHDLCECRENKDCPDDGDKCNGTMLCDTGVFPYRCAKNEGSVPPPCADDGKNPCTVPACDPKTGSCVDKPVGDGTPCDDGDKCTGTDRCAAGACAGTTDICSCKTAADCEDADGDPCTGVPYCKLGGGTGVCTLNKATIVKCSTAADSQCAKNACDKATGTCKLKPVKDDTSCDDGQACTKGEVCVSGTCAGGTDTCKCTANSDCAGSEDGNKCNGTLFCDKASGKCKLNPATVVHCPTVGDTACVKNVCAPKTGKCAPTPREDVVKAGCQAIELSGGVLAHLCTYLAKEASAVGDSGPFACEDGDPCTVGDKCQGGSCKTGTKTCECKADADCAKLDDGDLCNGTMFCKATTGSCVVNPATVIKCQTVDDTACLKNTCAPKSGACLPTAVAPGTKCDDGDKCTSGDVCKLGACKSGTFVCECKADGDCAAKDDGDLCNGVFFCDKSAAAPKCKPQPSSAVFCSKKDDTDCLRNTCKPKTGKCAIGPVKAGAKCDDGKFCTVGEVCAAGVCGGGKLNPCDDGHKCTIDTCDAKAGCRHKLKTCSDGNDCTVEACDAKTGQCSAPVATKKGGLCNADGDGCTAGDFCNGKGACLVGKKVQCKQPASRCHESLCQSKNASEFACIEAAREDKSSCDDGKSCLVGAICSKGKCLAPQQGTLYANKQVGPVGGWSAAHGIAATAGTDYYVGGARRAKASDPATKNEAFVSRLTHTGKVVWTHVSKGDLPADFSAVVKVARTPQDGVVALAAVKLKGNTTRSAVLDLLTAEGKFIWRRLVQPSQGATSVTPFDVAVNKAGAVAYVASLHESCGGVPCESLVMRTYSPTGAIAGGWFRVAPTKNGAHRVSSATVRWRDENTVFVSGTRNGLFDGKTRTYTGFDYVVSPTGTKLNAGPHGPTSTSPHHARVMLPVAHTWATTIRSDKAPTGTGVRLRFEQLVGINAKAVGYDHYAGASLIRADFDDKSGTLVAAGHYTNKPRRAVYIRLVNRRGAQIWSIAHQHGSSDVTLGDIAIAPGNRVLIATTRSSGNNSTAHVTRSDAWLNTSCTGSGECAGKGWATCNDGKPCTRDGCKNKFGCQFTLEDGYACDVTNGCSAVATCKTGKCVQSPYGLIKRDAEGIRADRVIGPFPNPAVAGGIAVYSLFGGQAKASVRTVDAQLAGAKTLSVPAASGIPKFSGDLGLTWPVGGKAPVQYQYMVWGTEALSGGRKRAGFVRKGGPSWMHRGCATSTCSTSARQMVIAADASTWVVMRRVSKAGGKTTEDVLAQRFGNKAVPVLAGHAWPLNNPAVDRFVHAAARTDGGLVLAQNIRAKTASSGFNGKLRAIALNGSLLYTAALASTKNVSLSRVAALADGGAVAVGTLEVSASLLHGYVVAVGAKGKVKWVSVAKSPDGRRFSSVVPLVDRVLVGGARQLTKGFEAFLGAIDYQGGWQWERTVGAASGTATGLMETADGGIVFAWLGSSQGKSGAHTLLLKTNAWGHGDCLSAGKCGGKGLVDCDDGNPCTVDVCDAKLGCSHVKTAGGICATGRVCKAGQCVAP